MQRKSQLRRALALTIGLAALATASAQGPADPATPGCTLHKRVYVCNWQTFQQTFARAKTIAIETPPMDHPTRAQLRTLLTGLGKTPLPAGSAADLTLVLSPVDTGGVYIGPSNTPLATLRIYAPGPQGPRSTLIWAETYTGQPDRPWPVTVHTLIAQFQSRFHQP